MLDHTQAAPALKSLNEMPAREARRTAIAFLVSEDTDTRDMLDALADYLDASCKASFRDERDDEDQYFAAERMAEHAHRLLVAMEVA